METKPVKTRPDVFLIAIVAGIVLMVAIAFIVVLLRPKPTYQTDDSPTAAAHNYLLALQQKDYARAYGYLSPRLDGYPNTVDRFTKDVRQNDYSFGGNNDSTTLEVLSSEINGADATVTIRETNFTAGGLFNNNQYTHTFEMTLTRPNNLWKITNSESYWAWCWNQTDGCGN